MKKFWIRKSWNLSDIIPGLRLNLSKRGLSPSVGLFGVKGLRVSSRAQGLVVSFQRTIAGLAFGYRKSFSSPLLVTSTHWKIAWAIVLYMLVRNFL